MSNNPYAPPITIDPIEEPFVSSDDVLAGRFTRFAAAFVDGLAMLLVFIPVIIFSGYFERARAQKVGSLESLGMSLLGVAVMLALNGYLLYSRGQTVGKFLTKIQIVDFQTGALLPFLRVYVKRYLWSLPLTLSTAFIPGIIDDQLINLVVLLDVLMIFGKERRCLHDYIAGSKVVEFKENRARLA
ncbi:MAG: RDD family protein [Planctomycetota bacterium]|jgi:uncharacterized RDD family membrane protein YckC